MIYVSYKLKESKLLSYCLDYSGDDVFCIILFLIFDVELFYLEGVNDLSFRY